MKTRLAELGEASILQIFPYRKSKDNHLEESFNQANKMFSEGVSLNEIWKKTGFFLRQNTNNGKWEWAYRIDQNKMNVRMPALRVGSRYNLSDIVKYPAFFSIFPKAKDITVRVTDNVNRQSVMDLSVDGKTLTINLAYYKGYERSTKGTKETIAHELQHYVQTTEHGGGTSDNKAVKNVSRRLRSLRRIYNGGRLVLGYKLTDADIQEP
ncbi:MAG: hypothetical protein ACTJGD_11760 [Mesonia hippocampi]|uniref:hypothetical protein n=1 Tax=Mesonia hippocampi TaxID=1628250 RepID=UPI003F945111